MIVYDLRCINGHVFEAWFKDRQSYLDQKDSGRVECPACGSTGVDIAFTGCSIHTDKARNAPPAGNSLIYNFMRYLETNFENVGAAFAEEARRIKHGESTKRNIRGVTTAEEEQDLLEEGIDFIKIPSPKLDG